MRKMSATEEQPEVAALSSSEAQADGQGQRAEDTVEDGKVSEVSLDCHC